METKKNYSVNPNAENILNAVATIGLAIGWVLAIISIIVGIAVASQEEIVGYALVGILAGGVILLIAYITWAQLKVIVNISRSLYNINDAIISQAVAPVTGAVANTEGEPAKEQAEQAEGRFEVGQLVIIKSSEMQFRISEIKKENGITMYYSEKFNNWFTEEKIEDFDKYWAEKDKTR